MKKIDRIIQDTGYVISSVLLILGTIFFVGLTLYSFLINDLVSAMSSIVMVIIFVGTLCKWLE